MTGYQHQRPAARWISISLASAFALLAAWQFVKIESSEAYVWTVFMVASPVAGWVEARAARKRGNLAAAESILWATAAVLMMFWMLAMYAGGLSAECR